MPSPTVIDSCAAEDPDKVFAIISKGQNLQAGFETLHIPSSPKL
jgi:hypothetical protein